jgi:hypothetical protein
MCLKGELGDLGEPDCFLVENTVNGVPPERETPGNESSLNISNEPSE